MGAAESAPLILVVDDEPQVLEALRDTLEDEFRLFAESSAEGAMARLEGDHDFSVILSDERMPGTPGHEFLATAREMSDATRVLITAYSDLDAVIDAVNEGRIFGYVSKPWDPSGLKFLLFKAAEHYRLLNELRSREERFRQLAENIRDTFWIVSADGSDLIYISPGFTRIWDVPEEVSLVDIRRWREMIHPDDREAVAETWNAAMRKHEVFDVQYRVVRRDGSHCWVHDRGFPVKEDTGQIYRYAGLAEDITQQKQAERHARLLFEVAGAVAGEEGFDRVLGIVLTMMCDAFEWDYGEAWLPEAGGSELMLCPHWHGDRERFNDFRKHTENISIEPHRGIVGTAWGTQESVWVPDITALPEGEYERIDAARDTGVQAAVGIPVLGTDGELLAVLAFAVTRAIRDDETVVHLTRSVASQLGEVITRKISEERARLYAKQQEAIAKMSRLALEQPDLQRLMDQVVEIVARTLEVDYVKLMEHLPEDQGFLLRSGTGWRSGLVGNVIVPAGAGSQAGYTLQRATPVIVEDLRTEKRFKSPELLTDHGVRSALSVAIPGTPEPFGVLGADSASRRSFSSDDASFLSAAAYVVSEAIRHARDQKLIGEKEENIRLLLESTAEAIYGVDVDGICTFANPSAARLLGYGLPDELVGQQMHELVHHSRADGTPLPLEECRLYRAFREATGVHGDDEVLWRADGSSFPVEYWSYPIRQGDSMIGAVVTFFDITERRQQEQKIARLTRIHEVLSGVNSAIVRIHERDPLFREACRIAVEHGGFPLARVGVLDEETGDVVFVAHAGAAAEYAGERIAISDPKAPGYGGMTAKAVRLGKPVVISDIAADPLVAPRRDRALKHGFRSVATFPLTVGLRVSGVFSMYASEPAFFNDEEMRLLSELAGDISFALDYIEKEQRANYLAYHDSLTGLANRAMFLERLAQFVMTAASRDETLALVMLNLDRFKHVNDAFGRHNGDQLIRDVAGRLVKSTGEDLRIGHIHGDQFALVLSGVLDPDDAAHRIESLFAECFGEPYSIDDQELRISATSGIAMFPDDAADGETLFQYAEAALKRAKRTGDSCLFFTEQMTARVAHKLKLETELRRALQEEQFVLHYQPRVDVNKRHICGFEALIRWQHPERGLVPPGEFIDLLEEFGLILPVGAWALFQAARDYHAWLEAGLDAPRLAVNVSAIQLRQHDFAGTIKEAIAAGGDVPCVDLEITESLIMDDIEGNVDRLREIQALGVNVAIDDFGTGYSSLAYLARLPVNSMKIDRTFISLMHDDPASMTLVSTMISLAHSLNLKVCAEGVETEEQANMLRLLRCEEMQGYLVSKPVPADQAVKMLKPRAGG